MYFLVDICRESVYDPIWELVGLVVRVIWIGIPILLIVLGMIDLGKAVIANDEKEVQKSTKAFGKRFLYAVLVFLVVWIVGTVFSVVTNVAGSDVVEYDESWKVCWSKIMGNYTGNKGDKESPFDKDDEDNKSKDFWDTVDGFFK